MASIPNALRHDGHCCRSARVGTTSWLQLRAAHQVLLAIPACASADKSMIDGASSPSSSLATLIVVTFVSILTESISMLLELAK